MEIDHFLPIYEFSERHATRVNAPVLMTYEVYKKTDFSKSVLIRFILAIRGIKVQQFNAFFDTIFTLLHEDPANEVIYGLIARPWETEGGLLYVDASFFRHFSEKGYAKIVWGFSFCPSESGTLVSTETRIHCTDPASKWKFRLYWFFIKPLSGLMRIEMLRLIKKNSMLKVKK